jgi:hypothetical protein
MNAEPIPFERYQPGGDIFDTLWAQYGAETAYAAAAAALDDDGPELSRIIRDARSRAGFTRGEQTATGTLGNLWEQLTTDPLAAPLESANNQIGKAVLNVLKNPWVLLALAGVVFYLVGGFDWIKRKVAHE